MESLSNRIKSLKTSVPKVYRIVDRLKTHMQENLASYLNGSLKQFSIFFII